MKTEHNEGPISYSGLLINGFSLSLSSTRAHFYLSDHLDNNFHHPPRLMFTKYKTNSGENKKKTKKTKPKTKNKTGIGAVICIYAAVAAAAAAANNICIY